MKPRASVRSTTIRVVAGALIWFTAAMMAGGLGLIAKLPMPVPQVILLLLTITLLLLFSKVASLREWAFSVSPRVFGAVHLCRFVGFYFLYLYGRGELPWAFAVPGGWGDVAVATTAIFVLCVSPQTETGRRVWLVWNTLGFIDILFVVSTAARLGLADRESMRALGHLPLSLLVTFVVPIIIASHLILFAKLRRRVSAP